MITWKQKNDIAILAEDLGIQVVVAGDGIHIWNPNNVSKIKRKDFFDGVSEIVGKTERFHLGLYSDPGYATRTKNHEKEYPMNVKQKEKKEAEKKAAPKAPKVVGQTAFSDGKDKAKATGRKKFQQTGIGLFDMEEAERA